jgi:hypothetical protein
VTPDRIASRLFVCYVPGLDARRITAQRTPFVEKLRTTCPTVALETFPGGDLLPTILTGVYPHEHRLWQVSLRPEARIGKRRLADLLPGFVSATGHALRAILDPAYDFPALPSRRRRQFNSHRMPPTARERKARGIERMGEFPTVFGIMAGDSRYLFAPRLAALERMGKNLPGAQVALEFLDVEGLDLLQRWRMNQTAALERGFGAVDEFLRHLHERCRERGVTLMLLVDHGQEPVFGSIPLGRLLKASRVPETDYSHYIDLTMARFWCHAEGARARLTETLRNVPHTRLLALKDLRPMHIAFEDDSYGEMFLAAEPGWTFFPHDRYHPLVNAWKAVSGDVQGPRMFNPRRRGAHGYLPEHPSEAGFVILADPGRRALRARAELIDVTPTFLATLGEPPPSYMRGKPIFG